MFLPFSSIENEGNSVYTSFQSNKSGYSGARHLLTASSRNSDGRSRLHTAISARFAGNSRPMTAVSGAGYQSVKGEYSFFVRLDHLEETS